MGEFGWAYITGSVRGLGPADAVQFLRSADGEFTGSHNFTFDNSNSNLFVTGSVYVSGTLSAHTFDIIQTNVIELSSSGDSNFGNDSGDNHVFTGSVTIVSGAFARHYYKLTSNSYTVNSYDAIIGVSASGYVSIELPSAASTKPGTQIIIKDEYDITRSKSGGTHIAISGSGVETIDHQNTYDIEGTHVALSMYCDGVSKWFIY
jgi:hypothetical protein